MEIRFRHMERSEALEAFATEKFSHAIEQHLHHHEGHILIWLISERTRIGHGQGAFCCEVEVRYPPRRKVFVAKKNSDMNHAIQEAAAAVRVLVDEAGKRERHSRSDTVEIIERETVDREEPTLRA